MLSGSYKAILTGLHTLPTSFKIAIAICIAIVLYGCQTEKGVFRYMEKHPEMMERIDTTYQHNRVTIKREIRQAKYTRNVLAYNPDKPGDSLTIDGGRFTTTIKNVADQVQVRTRFNGIDTTFVTIQRVYKLPNVWIAKYSQLQTKYDNRTSFYLGCLACLSVLLLACICLLFLLVRGRISPAGMVGRLLGI